MSQGRRLACKTQTTVIADDGPLSASGPGDISKWMAVPWQTDTASCRAGYPGTEFPDDGFIPSFWPARVPNTVLSEANYQTVIDPSQPLDRRIAAFYDRGLWYQSLGPKRPYLEQISRMVDHFSELGVMERREAPSDANFPSVMYVETLPPGAPVTEGLGEAVSEPEGPGVSLEFAQARFGGLRRLRR